MSSMLAGMRERASNAGSAMSSAASGARGRVNQHLQSAMDKRGNYSELAADLHSYVRERTHHHQAALKEAGYGIKDKAGAQWDRSKKEAEKRLFDMSEPVRAKVLLALREAVKSGVTADPDMFQCVRTRLEDLVDLFWDDLRITVDKSMDDAKEAALGNVPKADVDTLAELGMPPFILGPRWWRAQILYHMLPFDLSIFGNFKDPWFWVLMVFMCLPSFTFLPEPYNNIPVRVPFFIVYIICVVTGCPADEFQLVTYIMSIKGLQFLCSGVGMMCYAAYMYYMCVHPGGVHTCDKTGPGAKQSVVVSVADWIGTCVLVWIAFLWLPCSERSAGMREAAVDEEEGDEEVAANQNQKRNCFGSTEFSQEKGGRLRAWLGYDMCCFLISVATCIFLMCVDLGHMRPGGKKSTGIPKVDEIWDDVQTHAHKWTGHAAIYWARLIYALLSFPFLFFWIPGLQGVLTHTRLTGYNKNGVCVPYMLHPMPPAKDSKNSRK